MKDYVIGIDIGGTKCAVVLGEAGEADEAVSYTHLLYIIKS